MAKAGQIEDFFRSQGLSSEQTQGILAGIYAETSFRADVIYGYRSGSHQPYGIGQWLGFRKRRLFSLYGPHPTLNQQLWFMWKELHDDPYDDGGYYVLSTYNRYDTLRAYIVHFMRPGSASRAEIRRGSYWLAYMNEAP